MNNIEAISYIQENIDERVMLELIAEEAAELSQAALKHIRSKYKGNPTPKSAFETYDALIEEVRDLNTVLMVAGLQTVNYANVKENEAKIQRWASRIELAK